MDNPSAEDFFSAYQPYFIGFAVMAVLVFVLMRLLLNARHVAEDELMRLKGSNIALYLERLENNRRLLLVFRKPVILLLRLEGYMKIGDDVKIRQLIKQLDGMRLEPRDRVDYLQKQMSFFISVGEEFEARASFKRLFDYLRAVKADEVEIYRAMIAEGKEIIRVYLDKDVDYMPKLDEKARSTEHPVLRGVKYYRLAKLSYFKGDREQTEKYLDMASETLSGTDYEEIIRQARITPAILNNK